MKKNLLAVLALTLLSSTALAEMDIKFNGDLRYRHETISEGSGASKSNVERDRIRARLKATTKISDTVKATLRIATGGTSITSTNETLNDQGANDSIGLDMAYADWSATSWANVYLGKMKNVFYKPGKSDLMFDGDWTPEGLATRLNKSFGMLDAQFNLSYYRMSQAANTASVNLVAPQLVLTVNLPVKVVLGTGFYNYSSVEGSSAANAKGNSTLSSNYSEKYKIIQFFAEVKGKVKEVKYSFFADLVKNTALTTTNKEDAAYLLGFKLKCKKWKLGYDYRWSENDAFLGAIADGDSCGGGTGCQGHRISLGKKLHKHISAKVIYFGMRERANPKAHYDKLHLDVAFKF
ncbi:hypothetical protein A9Q84_16265 [Halobacteriovorax marinus]|uniref:Porin domain-containing protein n=1 Tax=Halobacteriovorax marinus TaxID=97084 RepID=A0A1Y5F9Q2_9BACT|nr:hypothetical protein A9Q84_16265 [Halobacteriovorax marinus]